MSFVSRRKNVPMHTKGRGKRERDRDCLRNEGENEIKPAITLKTLKKDFRGNNSARRKLITEGPKQTHTLKNRYRDLNRLINKLKLKNLKISKDLLKKKESLEVQLGLKQIRDKEKAYAVRYHKVKFFERKKIIRRIKSFLKSNQINEEDLESGNFPSILKDLFDDLKYILFHPKDQKYISLYANSITDEQEVEERDEDEEQTKKQQDSNRSKALSAAKKAGFDPLGYVTKYIKSGAGKKQADYNEEANLDPEYDFEQEINNRTTRRYATEESKTGGILQLSDKKLNSRKKASSVHENKNNNMNDTVESLSDNEDSPSDDDGAKHHVKLSFPSSNNKRKRKFVDNQSTSSTLVDSDDSSVSSSSSSNSNSNSSSSKSTSSEDNNSDMDDAVVSEEEEVNKRPRKRTKPQEKEETEAKTNDNEEKEEKMEEMDDFFLEEVTKDPSTENEENSNPGKASLSMSRRERRRQFIGDTQKFKGMKNGPPNFHRGGKNKHRNGL